MKKMFMLLLMAAFILPISCTESKEPTPEPTPEPVKTYTVGEYYSEGLARGIVAWVDESGEHGLLISLDETTSIWSTDMRCLMNYGLFFTLDDGAYNTELIKGLDNWQELYPAFAWCDKKNVSGIDAWFLPSPHEIERASWGLEAINATLAEMGKTTISTGANDAYWTSTEFGIYGAYSFSFFYGEISSYDTNKDFEHFVRAMRKF